MQNFKSQINNIKSFIVILFLFLFLDFGLDGYLLAIDKSGELKECIVITHCVRKDWQSENIVNSFEEAYEILKETPRTKIVEKGDDYIHAEAKTRWLHYTDDVEIKALKEKGVIQIRSESRVGIGDNGVNNKRVNEIKGKMSTIIK
tara:strand:- start:429 stop:866 length:438 start_codon:yes stop_codon:yes gene_type:complete